MILSVEKGRCVIRKVARFPNRDVSRLEITCPHRHERLIFAVRSAIK